MLATAKLCAVADTIADHTVKGRRMSHQFQPARQPNQPPPPAPSWPVAREPAQAQRSFMVKVYAHLLLAVAAFVGLEWFLFETGLAIDFTVFVGGTNWLLILAGFMVASWLAQRATASRSVGVQYAGLFGLVAAYALIFTPLLTSVMVQGEAGLIGMAAAITLVGFVALSGIAITTAVDFKFLRSLIMWGGVIALGLIVLGVFGVLQLGGWFSVAMIGLAGAAVLYDTQKIRQSMPVGREVGAAASLFGSVAMMFYYILMLLSRR